MLDNYKVCCICGKVFEGYGNDPWPVQEEGKCCDDCNMEVVVPIRIAKLKSKEEKETEKKMLSCAEIQCFWNDGTCHCICPTKEKHKLIPDKYECYFFTMD